MKNENNERRKIIMKMKICNVTMNKEEIICNNDNLKNNKMAWRKYYGKCRNINEMVINSNNENKSESNVIMKVMKIINNERKA